MLFAGKRQVLRHKETLENPPQISIHNRQPFAGKYHRHTVGRGAGLHHQRITVALGEAQCNIQQPLDDCAKMINIGQHQRQRFRQIAHQLDATVVQFAANFQQGQIERRQQRS